MMQRRNFIRMLLGGGMLVVPAFRASAGERVVHLAAKRFEYMPPALAIPAGEAVVLEVTVSDVVMGFNLPDLKLRTDLVPGQPARLHIPPQSVGELVFTVTSSAARGMKT
ncbi:cupredoxin domain-containing protein [Jeongeupia chitinilytica]|uniref:Cytochrome oxidase subunit II copper A binding domain-containing protein n=1 Tax=Jeongeupia chitinilytica TaxID=1041641 RepID=A0ABQ3GY45_9NEIS|nr:cupredoxin domain-containing protein [Jeongeupia chitinilytica]GHD60826.1 hypothetical protein GCM10007350_14470 [Jeongeupia chitinilytica]